MDNDLEVGFNLRTMRFIVYSQPNLMHSTAERRRYRDDNGQDIPVRISITSCPELRLNDYDNTSTVFLAARSTQIGRPHSVSRLSKLSHGDRAVRVNSMLGVMLAYARSYGGTLILRTISGESCGGTLRLRELT